MTPPTGFVYARRTTGVVKVADRYLPEGNQPNVIPGGIVGPGDIAVIGEGEAADSEHWEVIGLALPEPVVVAEIEAPKPKNKTGGNG